MSWSFDRYAHFLVLTCTKANRTMQLTRRIPTGFAFLVSVTYVMLVMATCATKQIRPL